MQSPRDNAPKSADGRPDQARPAPKRGRGPARVVEPPSGDVERQVREALAEHLRRCPTLPPSLAKTLSADALSLRLPSEARPAPSSAPSDHTEAINGTALQTPPRPLDVLQQAIYRLCGDLCRHLAERHDLPPELAGDMAMHGRERALTRAMGAADADAEIERLVASLAAEDALTPTLLLRSLSLGRLAFFGAAMARLAGDRPAEARRLIFEGGAEGFQALYERSGQPSELFRAFRAAMEVVRGLGPEPARDWRREYTNRIIARLVNEYEQVCPEDLEHVLCTLSRRLKPAGPSDPLRETLP